MRRVMRLLLSVLLVCVLAAIAGPAWSASRDAHEDCDADDPDRNIVGCTRIIEDADEGNIMRGAAYVARGLAWQKKGDGDKALADYNDAIRVNPKDALAYNDRGLLWRERGEPDRAIADFTTAIAINPMPHSDEAYASRGNGIVAKSNVNIYENRALTLLDKSDLDGAIAGLRPRHQARSQGSRIVQWTRRRLAGQG
jgi:tetratricopeptide (TPR) repeat protein